MWHISLQIKDQIHKIIYDLKNLKNLRKKARKLVPKSTILEFLVKDDPAILVLQVDSNDNNTDDLSNTQSQKRNKQDEDYDDDSKESDDNDDFEEGDDNDDSEESVDDVPKKKTKKQLSNPELSWFEKKRNSEKYKRKERIGKKNLELTSWLKNLKRLLKIINK